MASDSGMLLGDQYEGSGSAEQRNAKVSFALLVICDKSMKFKTQRGKRLKSGKTVRLSGAVVFRAAGVRSSQ
jgi:hypothetical protein